MSDRLLVPAANLGEPIFIGTRVNASKKEKGPNLLRNVWSEGRCG